MSESAVRLEQFTQRVQRDTAAARNLAEDFRSILVSTRDAVDGLALSIGGPSAAGPTSDPAEEFVREAAREVANATIAVANGHSQGSVHASLQVLSKLNASDEFEAIKTTLAPQIAAQAAESIHLQIPQLSEESLKLLIKIAIQSLRGALDESVDRTTKLKTARAAPTSDRDRYQSLDVLCPRGCTRMLAIMPPSSCSRMWQ